MQLLPVTIPILTLMLATGCASQPAGYDYDESVDFSQLHRWAWLPQRQEKSSGDVHIDSPLVRKRIEAAVTRTLQAKGYQQADTQEADFDVGYLVTVDKRLSSSGVSSSVGFGRYSGGSGFGISFGGPGTQPREYEEGTLIIDFKNQNSGKLIWRGSSTRRLGQAGTPEKSEKMINEVVEEILANFPPERGT